jgi:hypothetical protein
MEVKADLAGLSIKPAACAVSEFALAHVAVAQAVLIDQNLLGQQ